MFLGTFLAYDKHLNIVLSECEEFRRIKPKKAGDPEKEIKRALGMIILRGENIVSITAEAPPTTQQKKGEQSTGPGKAQPIDRSGVQLNPNQAPLGLGGMPKGAGQINMQNMIPMQKTTTQQGNISMQLPGQMPGQIPGGVRPPTGLPPMMGMPGGLPGMIPMQNQQQGGTQGGQTKQN